MVINFTKFKCCLLYIFSTDCINYGIGGQTTKECSARIVEPAKKNYGKVVMLAAVIITNKSIDDIVL